MSDLRCYRRIWRGFHLHQCTRRGTLEYGGKWFCKQHHPPTTDARYEERKNQRFEQFHAKQHAEHEALIADGWRRCAVGQRTTQHCGLVEDARAQERQRMVALIKKHIMRFENGEYFGSGVGEYDEVVALKRLLHDVEDTSHAD